MDATSRPGKKGPDIRSFVVSVIVADDVNDALAGVAGLDLGQKLRGTDPINRCGLDKGCVESLKVQGPMNPPYSSKAEGIGCVRLKVL